MWLYSLLNACSFSSETWVELYIPRIPGRRLKPLQKTNGVMSTKSNNLLFSAAYKQAVNWLHCQHPRGLVFKSVKIKRLDRQSTLFIIAVATHKLLMLEITLIRYKLYKPWISVEALRS